jgi:hypothetical protein
VFEVDMVLALELLENKFLLFSVTKFIVICYGSPEISIIFISKPYKVITKKNYRLRHISGKNC